MNEKTLQKSSEESLISPHKRGNIVSWFPALKQSWRAALRLDRSQITAVQAIRSTIGFVLPLAIGVATGHVIEGVSMAGGAATLGSVGLNYTYRARARTMLLACIGIAFSAFIGSITSRIDWLVILIAGIWGISAGLLVAISQFAMIVGLQSAVALIILTHFALNPAQAAIQAGLMFAGALLQVVLAIIPFPWQHTAPERAVLSTVYQKLADYALDPSHEQGSEQLRDALLKAHSTLSDSNTQSQKGRIFFGLLEEADRIRLGFIVLVRLRQNLANDSTVEASSIEYLDTFLSSTAEELLRIAKELQSTGTSVSFSVLEAQIKKALAGLRRQATAPHHSEMMQQILLYCDALRNQLHTAKKLAKSWKHTHQQLSVHIHVPRQAYLRFHNTGVILRANLTLRSTAFRHAIRLGVTLALATALYRILPLPIERGYWIPLTALLVLKPDFTTTFTRGVARLLGTMLGAVLTTLLVSLLKPTMPLLVILDAIMAYLAFSILFVNYAIFSAFITMETVFLLTFVAPQPLVTVAYRAIDTVIGGILALLIYALWPTWELPQVPGKIADRLEAIRHYFVAIMQAYVNPNAYDELAIHNLRMASRLARSNAEASVTRSLQEPAPHQFDPDLARGLLEAADNIIQRVLALEAYLIDNPSGYILLQFATFSSVVDAALQKLAAALREEHSVTDFPNLQEALHTLEHAERSTPPELHADLHVVITEAKRIIRNIDAMKQLLSTKMEGV